MIKTIARILGVSVLLLMAIAVVLFLLQLPIPLGKLSDPASALLTHLTGSKQSIHGNYYLTPGRWTTLTVQDGLLELSGKEKFRLKAEINAAQITVHLWSLFAGQINLDTLAVQGMELNISGEVNKPPSGKDEKQLEHAQTDVLAFDLVNTGRIDLADISVNIAQNEPESQISFQLLKAAGRFSSDSAGQLKIEAALDKRKFRAELTAGPLTLLKSPDTQWPFSIQLQHKSVSAKVNGTLATVTTNPSIRAELSISGEHVEDLVSIFGLQGAKKQPFTLQGTTTLSQQDAHIDLTTFQPGSENLHLSISVKDAGSEKAQYTASLQGEQLDLDVLMNTIISQEPSITTTQPRTETTTGLNDNLFPDIFPVKNLMLEIDLGELIIKDKKIKNIRLDTKMKDGITHNAPFAFSMHHSSFAGHYSLDIDSHVPQFSLQLDTNALNAADVFKQEQLAEGSGLHFDNTKTELNTTGKTIGELLDNLDFTISANDGIYEYQDFNTGAIHALILDNSIFSVAPGENTQLTVQGKYDDSAITLSLAAAPLADLAVTDADWPFAVAMQHKSVAIHSNGTLANVATEPRLSADISLSGEHFNDFVSIFGFHGSQAQPFSLQGYTTLSRQLSTLGFTRLQPGSTNLQFFASAKNAGLKDAQYTIAVQGKTLDLDALKGFFTPQSTKNARAQPKHKANTAKINLDDVIFPDTFLIRNMSLDLDLKELVMMGKKMNNIRLDAVMHDGIIDRAPFAASLPHASLTGHFSLNTSTRVPQLATHIDTSAFNIGQFLKENRLAEGIVMHIDNVKADLNTSGHTLGELFDNLVFTVNARDGIYEFHDHNTDAVLPILLHKTNIAGVPGEKISLKLQGKVNDVPILISTDIDDRRDEPRGSIKDVTFSAHVRAADTHWDLTGKIPLPYRKEGISLQNKINGKRLSSLNELLHLELPDIGPYNINGTLSILDTGYLFNGMQLHLGSSVLAGEMAINTKSVPPEVRIGLQAQSIQLNDFRGIQMLSSRDTVDGSVRKNPEKATESKQELHFITDQELLDSYNAVINIEVNEVLSGKDNLGSGTLKIDQHQGSFRLDPLQLNLPKGSVSADFSLVPSAHGRLYHLNLLINNLDYGFVGRWFKPDTDISGIINLRTAITSESPDTKSIMANASGLFDFSLQPGHLRAGIIDLWAVNLLDRVIPFLTRGDESKINCAAGRFNIKDGILTQEELLLDTSRIQVNGDVKIDFNKNWIESVLRPFPKRPQFLSLATPIRITGPLTDFSVGITPAGGVKTIARLYTSYIVVPAQWIIHKKLPTDGTGACIQLFEERGISLH